jgi:cellulose synthase (UDP-forming)
MKQFYFNRYDNRQPYKAIPDSRFRTLLFQCSGILTIVLGLSYIYWRWRYSLNPDALWFAIPLALAETLSYLSTILIVINFWSYRDAPKTAPVH